jgi:hypothetical protein
VLNESKQMLAVPDVNPEKGADVKILKVGMKVCMKGKKEAIPDPFLVAMRAAINWPALHNTQLLPAWNSAPATDDGSMWSIEEIVCTQSSDDDCSVLSD